MRTIVLSMVLALLLIVGGPWGGGGHLMGAVSATQDNDNHEDAETVLVADHTTPLLINPDFAEPGEDGATPTAWEGPVMLEGETGPSRGELLQRLGFEAQYGSYVGYIFYASTHSQGWAGIAFEQFDVPLSALDSSQPLILSYRIRHQYSSGVDHITDHAGLVEIELVHEGETYLLRYLHRRHGDQPADRPYAVHIDSNDPGWQTWNDNKHMLNEDIAQAYPELESYKLTAVRIGVLMNKSSPERSSFYWLFDNVQLAFGGNSTAHPSEP